MSPRDRSGGLDGVLVVAKPSGPTSHDVVGLVRRLSSTRRVGHGGTLDPFAAGVLPIFLGKATRLAEYHLGMPKRYRATFCFGETSTTDDIDGERTTVDGPVITREALETALAAMVGPQQQVPPRYSAVQVEGRRAYQMARRGEQVELAPRSVTIIAATLLEWDDGDPARPVAVIDIRCTAGTYIRAIARDLGARLDSGAYLGALVRLESGHFNMDDAVSFEELREHAADGPAGIERALRPMDAGLEDLPHAAITWDEVRRMGEGLVTGPKTPLELRDAPLVLAIGPDGKLAAVCKAINGVLHPEKVLTTRPGEGGRPSPAAARGDAADDTTGVTEAADPAEPAGPAADDAAPEAGPDAAGEG